LSRNCQQEKIEMVESIDEENGRRAKGLDENVKQRNADVGMKI
jgi:hypothetical protein